MAPRKQKHWNILAAISILLAAVLAVSGISELDVGRVPSRDALRLASSSRALTTDTRRLPADGWTSLRGQLMSDRETTTDQEALENARFHIQAGVYATRPTVTSGCIGMTHCSSTSKSKTSRSTNGSRW